MIIVEMDSGKKIPYEVKSKKICFDDDLTINLAKREEDEPVHIDVCYDADYNLVMGSAAGRSYVAGIDIPERKYIETEGEDGTEVTPIPLDMNAVTLSLWAID